MVEGRYRASHRFARISPMKVRRIADLIRHKPVEKAQETLRFMHNRGARMIEAVLESAVANAKDREAEGIEEMSVVDVRIDEGPRMKRIQPHARGMAFQILKRMSHIHVAIGQE